MFYDWFVVLMDVKMPKIVGILSFMSITSFMNVLIFSGPPWRHSLSDTGKQMNRGDVNGEF